MRKLHKVQVVCELKQWHLDDENGNVTGTIANSNNLREYPDGERYTILRVSLTHYPAGQGGEEFWYARTTLGNYFKLLKSEMK